MGNKRYTNDEEKLTNESGNDVRTSFVTGGDRNSAIDGYKKIIILLIIFAVVALFRCYILDRVIVQGNSMNTTFSDGDVMWARKFNLQDVSRYSVVVANINGKLVIKRIIGLPNEKIQIKEGQVYINGIKLQDDYGYDTNFYGVLYEEYYIKDDEYFLMGDNRNDSLDSRVWGAVNKDNIKGVVVFQFFPLNKIKVIE